MTAKEQSELETLRYVWTSLVSLVTYNNNLTDSQKVRTVSNIIYTASQSLNDKEAFEAVR